MVHVRTVDGKTEVFGNQGALFMNAMTWWDHSTESVWSQVWGRAIEGPLTGTELALLPSQVLPWGAWRAQHPDTLLMSTGSPRFSLSPERAIDYYVIGVTLDDTAKAFPYEAAAQAGVINDAVGNVPVAVVVNAQTKAVKVFLRAAGGQTLTLGWARGWLTDAETGTTWDPVLGIGRDGLLKGETLRPIPYVPAFPSAWDDFYPHSTLWKPPAQ